MSNVNEIDLDALDDSAIEEEVSIDPNADPMAKPAPVDDGWHRVKLTALDSSQVEVKETKGNSPRPYIGFKFNGKVLAEGTPNNNKRVFGNVTTLVFDGKSEMARIIQVSRGNTPEAKAYVSTLNNFGKLAKAFRAELAGEPIIKVKTRWVAQRKLENGNYENVKSVQATFPRKKDGLGYDHVIFDTKTQSEVSAQAVIQDYGPDAA